MKRKTTAIFCGQDLIFEQWLPKFLVTLNTLRTTDFELPKLSKSLLNPDLTANFRSKIIENELLIIPQVPTTVTATPRIPNSSFFLRELWPL